ncbi:hypothetical protein C8R44DRAFT_814193 [Mycena epipterygia]|nr:hypothetical protein C8R44DRAFT_814193 [Mycena epipterygia]
MSATLSASSSRPWALVAARSSVSLASEGTFGDAYGAVEEVRPVLLSASASSDSLSFSSKAAEVHAKRMTGSSGSGSGSSGSSEHIYASPEVYTASEEEEEEEDKERQEERDGADGDDECSEDEVMHAFPRYSADYTHGHGRPYSEYAGSVRTSAASEYGHGSVYSHGHGHARAQSEYSQATHGHGPAYVSAVYEGDGYGTPVGREDSWMRARARSLARLRARKDVRRGGGERVVPSLAGAS